MEQPPTATESSKGLNHHHSALLLHQKYWFSSKAALFSPIMSHYFLQAHILPNWQVNMPNWQVAPVFSNGQLYSSTLPMKIIVGSLHKKRRGEGRPQTRISRISRCHKWLKNLWQELFRVGSDSFNASGNAFGPKYGWFPSVATKTDYYKPLSNIDTCENFGCTPVSAETDVASTETVTQQQFLELCFANFFKERLIGTAVLNP